MKILAKQQNEEKLASGGVLHKGLLEGVGQSTPGGGNKVRLKEGAILVRGGLRGIILGDNTAGPYFLMKDLIAMNFSNKS